MTEKITPHENTFGGNVRPLIGSDLQNPALKEILEFWLKDRETGQPFSEEVQEVMDYMRRSLEKTNHRSYLVAEADGTIIGMIGYKTPEGKMLAWQQEHMQERNPTELVNAYVNPNQRQGKGVGRALVIELEKQTRQAGFTDIILNSGPRYEQTGWGFYDRLPGFNRVDVIKEMYGKNGDAPVWRKILTPQP